MEHVIVRYAGAPGGGSSHGDPELYIPVRKPLWPGIVETGQGPLLVRFCRLIVTRYRVKREAGRRFVEPLNPLARVEPAVTLFNEPTRRWPAHVVPCGCCWRSRHARSRRNFMLDAPSRLVDSR
ncbi:MAG: hypothetical protein F4221_00030 [Rhodothermaceae bacterium]|nr:hypothetical protein [Rhodothermaceae bacterium]